MNNSEEIIQKYHSLHNENEQTDTIPVISLDGMQHKLGVSVEGYPKYFVHSDGSTTSIQNIIREILSVEYNVPCDLKDDSGVRQKDTFSIITLRTKEKSLQNYFIEIFYMMLQKLPSEPSMRELSIEVESLITIFSALTKPPKKKIQGLWAELLVIEQSKHPEVLINAWHQPASAKYDFTMGRDKIEVKSTSGENRIHHFSLDQLNPSKNSRLVVSSIMVRESAKTTDGLSVKDLYEKIIAKVSTVHSRLHLYKIIADTIGTDFLKLEKVFYDYTSAIDSLAFYDALLIPRIIKDDVPESVHDVSFSSDLTNVEDIRSMQQSNDFSDSILFSELF